MQRAAAVVRRESAAAGARGQRSLFGEILDWMLAPLLLVWPMSLALTWLAAQGIANKPFDRALVASVHALAQQVQVRDGWVQFHLSHETAQLLRADEADNVYYQVLGVRGEWLAGERSLPVPQGEPVVAGDVKLRDDEVDNDTVRVAYQWVPVAPGHPPALVQVAETLTKRSRLATEIVKGVILPQFVILPIAVLLVWMALARGLSPLAALQRRIHARASDDLSPIDEHQVPEEVSPLVRAINDLLDRQQRALATQKRFLADAAHQLKTPLAGLRMQAELAAREIDAGHDEPAALKASLAQMSLASERAAHTVNQLLSMARADATGAHRLRARVDLHAVAMAVVQDLVPRALDKDIDLGYEGPSRAQVQRLPDAGDACAVRGHPVLLRELILNLVDNALQYTPAGGMVTVRVMPDPFGQVVVLQVEDSGPGIPEGERQLVFQPFYRALGTRVDGSGLGLAIVAEIARQHGATITLEDARPAPRTQPAPLGPEDAAAADATPGEGPGEGPGARFTLHFPHLRDPPPAAPPAGGAAGS